MWSDMVPSSKSSLIAALVVLVTGGVTAGVFVANDPGRWPSAIAIGCGIAAIGLSTLALRSGAK